MDFELEVKKLGAQYASTGYQVIFFPGPNDLPDFAKDFKVEILAKRPDKNVLISVKQNREEANNDANLPRYAEIVSTQPDWRFDFAILEPGRTNGARISGVRELSEVDIRQSLNFLHGTNSAGNPELAKVLLLNAWALLEAAMRFRLRANGQKVEWDAKPREMLNELFSGGSFSREEYSRIELAYRMKNELAHGFDVPDFDEGTALFLGEMIQHLLDDSPAATEVS